MYIFFYLLKKVIAIRGKFSSTALVEGNIWHKMCPLLTQYILENLPQNHDNFQK